ncbi:hypothetical protein QR680_014259 [Steinernema hermaphroditum]|uniref:RING-type domain-containing protein n=1 Tax=Steinernema hermaphroditum TaxID=289476 RepID=A0AA39IAW2_9BILA|nr:hypothetical protein QR680_014259 [Steinernema hermaphroditum]
MSALQNLVCPICIDTLNCTEKKTATTTCGHVFHDTCIGKWLTLRRSHRRCPTCRQKVVKVIPLFFSVEESVSQEDQLDEAEDALEYFRTELREQRPDARRSEDGTVRMDVSQEEDMVNAYGEEIARFIGTLRRQVEQFQYCGVQLRIRLRSHSSEVA